MAAKKKQRGATKEQLAKRAARLGLVPDGGDDVPPDAGVRMARRAAALVIGTGEEVTLATLVDPKTAVNGAAALLRLAGLEVKLQRMKMVGGGWFTAILVTE